MIEAGQITSPEKRHRLLKWKRDIILATSPATTGNSDDMPMHLIVLAMLKLETHEPRLDTVARIDAHSRVHGVHILHGGVIEPVSLGNVDAINGALRRVADHCKLSDRDRQAMFDAFKTWTSKDDRANDPHKERVH